MNESTAYNCCHRIKKIGRIRGKKSKNKINRNISNTIVMWIRSMGENHGNKNERD